MNKTLNIAACFLALAVNVQADNYVCIGVNQVESYTTLAYAENDATQMAQMLTDKGHTTTLLVGAEATREKILEALKEEGAIVYFAGHAEETYVMAADGQLTLTELSAHASTLLLDCCNVGNGLQTEGKTKIMAAAQYDAFEGDEHGLFSKYLLNWLGEGKAFSDETLEQNVRDNVMQETGGWQKPVFGYI
jgi:hypothetical protein